LISCFCYANPVSDFLSPEPLFLRRSDPIEVTRPHRDPGLVLAAARAKFGVNAIWLDVSNTSSESEAVTPGLRTAGSPAAR
jgi:hypothetical protein